MSEFVIQLLLVDIRLHQVTLVEEGRTEHLRPIGGRGR